MNAKSPHTATLTTAIAWLKAIGILFVVMHHFSRSLWLSAGMDAPPINQWQLSDAWVHHAVRAQYQPSFNWLFDWFARWGYVGVHMFMAASVIGHALGLSRPATEWSKFMMSKVRRIWLPSCMSVLIFAALRPNTNWWLVLAKLSWLSYLDPSQFFAINSPLWFLVLMFQYYAILPFVRMLDLGAWRLWLASAGLAYLTRTLLGTASIAGTHPYLAHACILTWLPALIIGMHLVRLRAESESAQPHVGLVQHIQWITLALVFVLGQSWSPAYPLSDSALTLTFVMLALCWRRTQAPRWVSALSIASFHLFLYHRPIISAVLLRGFRHFGDAPAYWAFLNFLGLAAALALIASIVLWRHEKQLR